MTVLSADGTPHNPLEKEQGMPIMTQELPAVTAGIDTHRDVHVAATIASATGQRLQVASFPTDPDGICRLEQWLTQQGRIDAVGIEGTGAYGSGVARHLAAAGHRIIEVDRPDRQTRRRHGKSDPVDAEAAARAVLAGKATGTPKARDGLVEAIRPLVIVHRSAVKDRTRALNQFQALVVTAPAAFRATMDELTLDDQLDRARHFRTITGQDPVLAQLRWSLRELARRLHGLDAQIDEIQQRLTPLVLDVAPGLVGMVGIGVHIAAQLLVTIGDNPERIRNEAAFARICGVAPIPASSGNTTRHRLDRGGDRHANAALHQAVLVRLSCHAETQAYAAKVTADERHTRRDAIRKLKRYLARRVFRMVTEPPHDLPPTGPRLRELRTGAGLAIREVARHLGWWPSKVSKIERQVLFNTDQARAIDQAIKALDNP